MDEGAYDTVRPEHFNPAVGFACFNLGGTVAPFGPAGAKRCTVEPGTKIFITSTVECSTFELPPGATDKELRKCTRDNRPHPSPINNPPLLKPDVTLDGKKVPVHLVETPLQNITLPAEPIPGLPAGAQGSFVGRGWVALLDLDPLTPGTHTIVIVGGAGVPEPITTTICVSTCSD